MAGFKKWGKVKSNIEGTVVIKELRCGSTFAMGLAFDGDVMDVVGDIAGEGSSEAGRSGRGGGGFSVAGVDGGTNKGTMIRREFVAAPSSHWNVSAGTNAVNSEWRVESTNTPVPDNLGFHEHTATVVE